MNTNISAVRGPFANMNAEQFTEFNKLAGGRVEALLSQNPAFERGLFALNSDNYTPPERTPWGGHEIPKLQGRTTDGPIVGEFWANSGHKSFPSQVMASCEGQPFSIPLNGLGAIFPAEIYGAHNVDDLCEQMPFLVKLLNSAGNLSIQVHPPQGYAKDKPSKTEAWYVIGAEAGAGIYLGLKEEVTKEEFERATRNGEDVTRFLNFVEVKQGEIYYIPAGTIHGIGKGVLLAEPQETSEMTFRVYDYGRRDKEGNPRQLHIDDSIATIDWDAPRGDALVQSLLRAPIVLQEGGAGLARHEKLVNEAEFTFCRATFAKSGDVLKGNTFDTEVQGWIVLNGGVAVYDIGGSEPLAEFKQGDPFLFAATFGHYEIRATQNDTVVVQTYRA